MGGEDLSRHQKVFEASDCGRLGRQAADHPWSALRVVKSCRKDCPTASVLLEAKAAALSCSNRELITLHRDLQRLLIVY